MKLYVVQMYRWGDEDLHSYIEGVYDTREEAEKHGKAEEECRAGKYEMKIWTHPLNEPRKLKYMTDEEIQERLKNTPGFEELRKIFNQEEDENGNT